MNRLATKAAPGEATVSYGWDLAGRITSVSDFSAAIAAPSTTAGYAATTTYDAMNRPRLVGWTPAAAQTAPAASTVAFAHGYDATNRRTSQTATDSSWWSYPPNSTTTTTAYTANNLNQYTAIGTVHPTYDGNGNPTYDGVFTYLYDAESRLTSIKQGATTVASYAYDAQGRRKSKTVGSTTTLFVTDYDNREVLEYDGASGAARRWYAFGQGPDAVLNQMNAALGTRETMITDIQGSIIGTLDSGGTLSKSGYQPFGENPTATSGTFRYTARRFDPETAGSTSQPSGLYYYRTRRYSPTWGRFLQPDPIGYAGGTNLYAYVRNDPLNMTDPLGLFTWQQGLQVAGGGFETLTGAGIALVTSETVVGAVAGGAVAAHGIDQIQAGLRGTDTFTSQGLQAAGLPQNTANAIDTGISGVSGIVAGSPVLPYSLFGAAISGGGQGTSLLSATARGFVIPGVGITGTVTEDSSAALQALKSIYGTPSMGGIVGRAASDASVATGVGVTGYSAYEALSGSGPGK